MFGLVLGMALLFEWCGLTHVKQFLLKWLVWRHFGSDSFVKMVFIRVKRSRFFLVLTG